MVHFQLGHYGAPFLYSLSTSPNRDRCTTQVQGPHSHTRPVWRDVEFIDGPLRPPAPPIHATIDRPQAVVAHCGRGLNLLRDSMDWSRPLPIIVRADGYPCAEGQGSQLSISLVNHGLSARTPAFLWVVGMAVMGYMSMITLSKSCIYVLQGCNLA